MSSIAAVINIISWRWTELLHRRLTSTIHSSGTQGTVRDDALGRNQRFTYLLTN